MTTVLWITQSLKGSGLFSACLFALCPFSLLRKQRGRRKTVWVSEPLKKAAWVAKPLNWGWNFNRIQIQEIMEADIFFLKGQDFHKILTDLIFQDKKLQIG